MTIIQEFHLIDPPFIIVYSINFQTIYLQLILNFLNENSSDEDPNFIIFQYLGLNLVI